MGVQNRTTSFKVDRIKIVRLEDTTHTNTIRPNKHTKGPAVHYSKMVAILRTNCDVGHFSYVAIEIQGGHEPPNIQMYSGLVQGFY